MSTHSSTGQQAGCVQVGWSTASRGGKMEAGSGGGGGAGGGRRDGTLALNLDPNPDTSPNPNSSPDPGLDPHPGQVEAEKLVDAAGSDAGRQYRPTYGARVQVGTGARWWPGQEPSNRSDAAAVAYRLDRALEGRAGDFRASIASHNAAFEAVTRQVGVHCAERGELLARLQVKEVSSLAHTPILTPVASTPVASTPVPPPVANHANTDTTNTTHLNHLRPSTPSRPR